MTDYWLMPLVGFLADTTLAAAKLVYAGIPERYPNIKWVLGHLGGAIPYLAERLDRGWEAFPDCRADISRRPTEYLRKFYYDGVNFDPARGAARGRFRRRRPRHGGERLSAPDRQHLEDEVEPRRGERVGGGAKENRWREREDSLQAVSCHRERSKLSSRGSKLSSRAKRGICNSDLDCRSLASLGMTYSALSADSGSLFAARRAGT